MYHKYTEEELRANCRTSLESFEIWARRLIHEKMVENYGEAYIDKRFEDGNYLIKKDVREHVHKMLDKEPGRFNRPVDTLFMEHIIYFLCNEIFYRGLFREALKYAYPQGREEVKEFLERLVDIRNALAHGNPISVRQAEKAICYSNDFIDGIKEYEVERGEDKVWNVPRIIRITDSLGNVFENPTDNSFVLSTIYLPQKMYCGDTYSVSVEIDSSFMESEYDIIWMYEYDVIEGNKNAKKYTITFGEADVGETNTIRCEVISKKNWHKYGRFDCHISVAFTVLPPIE